MPELPKEQRLVLTLPLQETNLELIIPSAVIVEWQGVVQQQEEL